MPARILDGAAAAAAIRSELLPQVGAFKARSGRAPALDIVLVGENPASQIYVRNKQRAGTESGLVVTIHPLPATSTGPDVLDVVERLNHSRDCDGILVQSPLPPGISKADAQRVFDAIHPDKDVDAFHPHNVGLLVQGRAVFAPCTPTGIMELLDREEVPIAGKRAVVIGRSEIVGKPMALLLLQRDATVTICHSRTANLPQVAAEGDILVAAVGRAGFVRRDFVKPGAVVIDVGINRLTDRTAAVEFFGEGSPRLADFDKRGSAVVGDVHPSVAEVAGALTPVPGGVGPLTIAMLLKNTLKAAERRAR
ncbi:MAG TPA: bifunctional 5,10-methylenetetrahydrofolate dehydrogenase/5,10-methenyltetrahydrofolate cyclohydrolase [Vicinamibacterales bacterium]|nr:bifunctional 5,10-methylenetetrahydrofolate dehydrogenase/5,10-methenyltetrahydrofolate cyclohydrolase [Vicinamibacterales bacterium]